MRFHTDFSCAGALMALAVMCGCAPAAQTTAQASSAADWTVAPPSPADAAAPAAPSPYAATYSNWLTAPAAPVATVRASPVVLRQQQPATTPTPFLPSKP